MIQQVEYDQQAYKQVLLDTFQAFIAVCERYQLRWFCSGGTCLGAVRHQGLIPWDDDVDVAMPREDYERLLALTSEDFGNGYGLIHVRNCEYVATFAKFYNRNTTLWEIGEIPFVYGVYVDIFPLDTTDMTKEQFVGKFRKFYYLQMFYQASQMHFSLSDVLRSLKNRDYKLFVKGITSQFLCKRSRERYRRNIIQWEQEFSAEKGGNTVCLYGSYWEREYEKSEWFAGYKETQFEGIDVRLPIGAEEYLSYVYGDYMRLPPVEKQVSHHYHYYLNLREGLTLEQVRQRMAQGERVVI